MQDGTILSPVESRASCILGVEYALTSTATILVASRLYVRLAVHRGIYWDDFFIFLACAIAWYQCVCMQLAANAGFGQHIKYMNPEDLTLVLLYVTIARIVAPWAITCVKVSVIISILRLVGRSKSTRAIQWTCYVNLAIFVPMTLVFFFILCCQCFPLSAVWNENYPEHKCIRRHTVSIIATTEASTSAASDCITSVLPILISKHLKLDGTSRIGLYILTGLGLIVVAFSVLRAIFGYYSFEAIDSSYALVPTLIYTAAEYNLGIILACIPICASMILSRTCNFTPKLCWPVSCRAPWQRSNSPTFFPSNDDFGQVDHLDGGMPDKYGSTSTNVTNRITRTFEVTVVSEPSDAV